MRKNSNIDQLTNKYNKYSNIEDFEDDLLEAVEFSNRQKKSSKKRGKEDDKFFDKFS